MNRNFEVTLDHFWDGVDQTTPLVARIRLRMVDPDFNNISISGRLERELLDDIRPKLQQLLESRFGKGFVRIEDSGIRSGSIEMFFAVMSIGGAVYTFFKDYEALRKGFLLFMEDVRGLRQDILTISHRVVKKAKTERRLRRGQRHQGTVSH